MQRLLIFVAVALSAVAAGTSVAAAKQGRVVDRRVSFDVVNNNQTGIAGATDGERYTIVGRLVGPRKALRIARNPEPDQKPAATLYLHGLGYGGFFWHLTEEPEYDYATQMARRGHVSVVIDRLGYGKSGKPPGNADSYAGQATVAHEIIEQLRSGDYDLAGKGRNPAFDVIGLAGHSASVFISQLEAAIFDDVDALILMSLGDLFPSPLAVTAFATTQGICLGGGELSDGATGAPQYAYFGQTDADFQRAHLFNVEPKIAEIATARRSRDPCGESGTALNSIVADVLNVPRIGAPVLILNGKNDALFPPPAGNLQKQMFATNKDKDVTQKEFANTGHGLLFGRTHLQVRDYVDQWMDNRGL